MNPNKNCHAQSPQTHLPVLTLGNHTSKSSIVHLFIPKKKVTSNCKHLYLWLFKVAMGNGPFIKMLYLLKMVDLSMALLSNQMEKNLPIFVSVPWITPAAALKAPPEPSCMISSPSCTTKDPSTQRSKGSARSTQS